MSYVLAAGGTGGHIIPAIAVADALRSAGVSEQDIAIVGVGSPLEHKLIPSHYEHLVIPFVPILGKGILGILKAILRFPFSLLKALRLYRKRKVKAVLGFGGYPSAVPVFAAFLLRIPCFLFEQNRHVGATNRLLAKFATKVFAVPGAKGFPASLEAEELRNPVRRVFWDLPSCRFVPSEKLRVFAFGGSQGSLNLNKALLSLASEFASRRISLTLITGEKHFESLSREYVSEEIMLLAFSDSLDMLLAEADLVVARAGAMTAAEIAAAARPALFVPLAIAEGHQAKNVEALVENGSALLVKDDENLATELSKHFADFLEQPERLQEMIDAAEQQRQAGGADSASLLARALLEA